MEQANLEPVIIEDLVRIGEDLGRTDIYAGLLARRLGRGLTKREWANLAECIKLRDGDRVDKVLCDMLCNSSRKALAAWLADPNAR